MKLDEVQGVTDVVWAVLAGCAGACDPVRLVFVSPEKRAGTTTLAAATAIGLVRHQRTRACLVETNVERPALAALLGLRRPGLTDVLDGRAELDDCVQQAKGFPGLSVLTAGTARRAVPGELTTDRVRGLLDRLGARSRYLILDAPPILERMEPRVLVQQSNGAILVLRARSTRRDAAERAHRLLVETGTPVLGSIFNAWRPAGPFGRLRRRVHGVGGAVRPARASCVASTALETWPILLSDGQLGLGQPVPAAPAPAPAAPAPPSISAKAFAEQEAASRRQIEVLERRIAKLSATLAQTEEALRRIAELKDVDPGLASIYRGVQGLSEMEAALETKRHLMKQIHDTNLELKRAIAQRPRIAPSHSAAEDTP